MEDDIPPGVKAAHKTWHPHVSDDDDVSRGGSRICLSASRQLGSCSIVASNGA